MKLFYTLFIVTLGWSGYVEDGDCLDTAIRALEFAEEHRGSSFSDEEATEYMNGAYAVCWSMQH
ncbi:hypothetical protein SAMN04489761_3272 [Tenacibaculum sp. MAR_2009_124]|uniref:hypothetical protein n=1 Tax=Tenacibaculum sp. MAR_2009_124 TaxID=1250059 RepID=UPI0008989CA6|nr:hypothetical protein [Tenacibaculum sp. MAR_2009_124]SEC54111.1 hypothetical protein SAMN04489761_3272 [Tenacibaculum sp. MAR_2009_124]